MRPSFRTRSTPHRTSGVPLLALLLTLMGSACVVSSDSRHPKTDTTVAAATPSAATLAADSAARDSLRRDSLTMDSLAHDSVAMATAGVTPPDSAHAAATAAGAADSAAVVTMYPAAPQRGGVIVVRATGAMRGAPACTWRGEPLPCYAEGNTVTALVPLPAEDPAGTFPLVIRGFARPVTRQITVADRNFGRELIFLAPAQYALVRRGAQIARDARAIRQVLATETPTQRWRGAWRNPGTGHKSSPYGIERFYYPATDSSRSVRLSPTLRTHGAFGTDTTVAKPADVPGWRHAGIDIPFPRGTPVRATNDGVVVDVAMYDLMGHTVVVDHGEGVHTAYFHLDTALVRVGDVVHTGSVLGRVGLTGLTTGPHLHYGVYVHGEDVDPAAWHAIPAAQLGEMASTAAHPERRR